MRPAHGTLRLLRTASLAAACTGLAWAGHDPWAGGPAGPGGFVLATVVLAPVLWHFTRVMRGFGDIFAVMATLQVILHLILQGSADPAFATFDTGVDHSGHGVLAHAFGFAPGMLLAHLWAALLASALLAYGESALWSLAALLSRALPPARARALPLPPTPGIAAAVAPVVPTAPALSAHRPRGPPAIALAA
ncbi:copper resistance protein [Nocardiopsis lambiniae]|uniref:Copper resistance protein n=1 Tax=Nocardiopsis lambiniae TaxID=3075539 RepID=A0ABU2MDH5_9ACTN|nr:copper resistance protein [Nocardiopsis sp. DSM 44743]MDT0330734.1 copper resistance protein [Nocardiopsis sp. DSM 44743]